MTAAERNKITEMFTFIRRYKHFLKPPEEKFFNSLDEGAETKYGMKENDRERLNKIINRLTQELA